eukprot:gene11522-4686_t
MSKFKLTLISRVSDQTPLASTMESQDSDLVNLELYKQDRKDIIKRLTPQTPKQLTIESTQGDYNFHVLTENGVSYLTLCSKSFNTSLAYSFLHELKKEFTQLYGHEVDKVERPYAFLTFDKFIKETAKMFSENERNNLKKLKDDIDDIQNIMKSSIKELVERGNKLEHLNKIGTDILDDSKKFKKKAIWLNKFHCLRIYYPVIIVLAIVFLVLVIRWKFY